MAMYDPSKAEEFSDGVTVGRKVLHGVGFQRWESSNNNPMLSIGFVCLNDIEGNGEEGNLAFARFTLTEKALNFFGLFCKSVGWMEPFDPMDDDTIEQIVSKAAFVGRLKNDTYKGKTRAVIDTYSKFSGKYDPEWNKLITKGEEDYALFLQRMGEKRNNSNSSGGGGGYSSSTDGYQGGGGGGDIPF